jgi:predicted ATPase/transcriptional regulator with XRE-family HTH domain
MDASFGNWVKRRRKALDLTQQELAQRVGCSLATIVKIESEERRPSHQISQLLAEHLEIPLDQRALFIKIARQEKAVNHLAEIPDSFKTPLSILPPVPTSHSLPSRLPHPVTSFIGREHELQAILQQLQNPACRLLTLTGPGGVGKTRLALEVAFKLQDTYEDGVFFVPLSGTNDPEFIVPAVAGVLDFTFSGTTELKTQFFHYLKDRRLLLVLDNLEHLLHGIELLAELLQFAPQIKLLATSREVLDLRSEWAFEVQGLPVPTDLASKDLESNSAAALFIRRAKQTRIDFTPSDQDVKAIVRICRLVDGLPLGLELAATWVRILSVDEIAREIERNIDFLTTSARDIPPRHRSIRAVFDYSWEMLTAEEQRILRQLAVFSGGFARDAAEQVAGARLSQLSALVDKSLLRHTDLRAGWYDFHELIRQYVEQKARENADEHTQLHERHAGYYAAWLQKQEDQLQGPQQQDALNEISREMDNVRSAWNWMVVHQKVSHLQTSLMALFVWHDIRNWLSQGLSLLEAAVTALQSNSTNEEPQANRIVLGELMVCQAHFCWHRGQTQKSRQLLQKSIELLGAHRNRPMLAEAFLYLSLLEHSQGNYPLARKYAEECVSLNRELVRDFGIGYALGNLGMVDLTEGRYENAYTALQESVAVMRSIDHPRGAAVNLTRLGLAALRLGRLEEAQGFLDSGIETTRRFHDRWGTGNALNYLGWLAREKGDLEGAESVMRESVRLFQEDDDKLLLVWSLADLGSILSEKNHHPEAVSLFLQAFQVAYQSQHIPAALYSLMGIGVVDAKTGAAARALQLAAYTGGHAASNYRTKRRAETLRAEMETQLTAEQIEAAYSSVPSMTLDFWAQELLSS